MQDVKRYVNRAPDVVKYAGSVGARVRMLCRGGCLPVIGSDCMKKSVSVCKS